MKKELFEELVYMIFRIFQMRVEFFKRAGFMLFVPFSLDKNIFVVLPEP